MTGMNNFALIALIFGFLLAALSPVSARPEYWNITFDSSMPDKKPENIGIYPVIVKKDGVFRLYVDVHVHKGSEPPYLELQRPDPERIDLEKTRSKDAIPDSVWYRGMLTLSGKDSSKWGWIQFGEAPWIGSPVAHMLTNPPVSTYVPDGPTFRFFIPLNTVQIKDESVSAK